MKTITIQLDNASIEKAIKEVEDYKKWLKKCTSELVKECATIGVDIATINFQNAQYDGTNDVSVDWESAGENACIVTAHGHAVLFIEFGSGVSYAASHPDPVAGNFPHGAYGKGQGKRLEGWYYYGDPGTNGVNPNPNKPDLVKTRGNPANQSLYMSMREIQDRFEEIARRVFK